MKLATGTTTKVMLRINVRSGYATQAGIELSGSRHKPIENHDSSLTRTSCLFEGGDVFLFKRSGGLKPKAKDSKLLNNYIWRYCFDFKRNISTVVAKRT
mgnify:CR=1 FL=1